jgi:hypothetical protein
MDDLDLVDSAFVVTALSREWPSVERAEAARS